MYVFAFRKKMSRAGVVAQSVKYLPYKRPRTYSFKVVHTYNPSAWEGQADLWVSMPSQPWLLAQYQANERHCLNKQSG